MEIIYLIIGLVVGSIAVWFIASFRFKGETGRVEERSSILEKDKSNVENDLKSERQRVLDLNSELSGLKSDYANLQTKLAEQKSEIEKLQEKFTKEFENLANKIFEEKGNKFSEQNKEKLGEILNPLKEKISEFEKKVEETNKESIDRIATLRQQILGLKELNQQLSSDAQNLTKALRGDVKAQGNWGEFILESILEKSGLVKDREYTVQESHLSEEGKRQQLDIIVKLPGKRNIIIDSKVSLVAYEKLISAELKDEKEEAMKDHLLSIKAHIKGLSSKNYQSLYNIETLDFIFLFIPIEGAFSFALQSDKTLFDFAWSSNIIIVCPSTLLGLLRTIENIWKQEYRNKFAMEIANESGKMYDKFVMFVQDLINVGEKMDLAKKSYSDAMKKLTEGTGTLVSKAEKIKKLGAKASKTLPSSILNRADIDDDENLLDN
jgi:DNA recombination protein RmuC